MRLISPCQATDFYAYDSSGIRFRLSDYNGRPIILSFFRDAACPFCNMRVFEYTQKYKEWAELGIEVVAVFSSSAAEVNEFIAKRPRPFKSIGDPQLTLYDLYGIEVSRSGFYKGLLTKIPRIIAGLLKGAKIDKSNPNPLLIPADFLIGPNGKIVDLWYGRDAGDNIPMQRIERFVERVREVREKQDIKKRLKADAIATE